MAGLEMLLVVAATTANASATEPDHAPPGYAKVFGDEFDGPAIDKSAWRFDTSRNAVGWYNQEKQYYSADRVENARVAGGQLVIEARSEMLDKARFPDWGGQKYTSARLIGQGLKAWTYGFYEIRAKIPCGRGTWPAIWMLPEDLDVEWPAGGEIDIMEHVGLDPGKVHQTIHTAASNFSNGTQLTKSFDLPDACTTFHRYQLLWTPDFLVTGVDDRPIFMVRRDKGDHAHWPFDRPMHIILNIAVGGTWGGQKGVDAKAFPAVMEVDYVRVYQKASK